MGRPTNAGRPILAGAFASTRRGGVSIHDIHQAREAIGPRATASMIARYLGRCVDDVQAILNPSHEGAA